MAAVRKSLLVGIGVVAAAWVPAMLFGACRGGRSAPAESPPAERPGPAQHGSATDVTAGSGAAADPPPPADAGSTDGQRSTSDVEELRALQSCSEPLITIVNTPDGGVVFNNAMTSADAGFIDRTGGIIDALVEQSDRIRCCLTPWAAQQSNAEGTLMLLLELDAAGQVLRADTDVERSTITDGLAVRCVLDAARQVRFPESPTGSPTKVEFPFVFATSVR
jgi:hypothetical protein